MASADLALEKGLPVNPDAERLVLGSILIDDSLYIQVAGALQPDDFGLESHRRIFRRMTELQDRGERIDRVTVAEELMRRNELESCGGLGYLISLDDGLPQIANVDSYVRIVRDKAALRRIIFASQKLIDRAVLGEESPEEILAGAEETLLNITQGRAVSGLVAPAQVIEEQGGINQFLDPSKRLKGISTGFVKLDEMTGGFRPGELIILAARPSMGKTAFALNIAQHVAMGKSKGTVAVFSLEMSKESLLTRMLCAQAHVDGQKFRAGFLNADERRRLQFAAAEMVEAPVYIDDTAGVNIMDMHAKLRRVKAEHDLALVVVDYLQLMSGRGRFENRNQEISTLSRGMKLLAKDLHVPMLVLSQLSRAPEVRQGDHRPQLSDLRESGCLTGDTLIPMADSGQRIPIRQLAGNSGFSVWALNEQTLKLEPAPVSRAFSTGVKTVFELRTRLGRTVRATGNHPFLTISGWKRLDELAKGERIALPRKLECPAGTTMSSDELALLGRLIGDGCTLPRHAMQYTTNDREAAQAVADLAVRVFGAEVAPRITAERRWYQVYVSSTRTHTHGVHSAVTDWLAKLGVFGLRSWEKCIPDSVFGETPEGIGTFLRHLWATDGCIALKRVKGRVYPHLYYASSSIRLARDVQSLLLRLEINARLTQVPQNGKGRDQFHVIISGAQDIERFCTQIGAADTLPRARLGAIRRWLLEHQANTNRDIIPSEIWRSVAVPAMREANLTTREMFSRLRTAYCGTSIYRQNISRERAARLAAVVKSERISYLANSDIYWDAVESIIEAGQEEVFDLTVPGHHNFVASDIIVHNSIEQDADLVGFIFREEVYRPDREDLRGLAELILAKQRNGPTGKINMAFLRQFTKFENLTSDIGEEEAPPPADE